MTYFLGMDIGGTQIKALGFGENGELLSKVCADTGDIGDNWKENVLDVFTSASSLLGKPAAVGIAAPGLAAKDSQSISYMPGRLNTLEGLDWGEFLNIDTPVRVLNDAHAALLGEVWQGAAQGVQDAILLTLGTGVGGAILSEGRLLRGHIGRAGHLGHISLDPFGFPDIVNTPGSLEDAVGNCSLAKRSGGRFQSTQELVAALPDDAHAQEIWAVSVQALSAGIASLINVIDPEVVILGGGMANAGDALFTLLASHLDDMEWRPGGHRVRIAPVKLGEFAGAYGAAWYAMQDKA